MDVRTVNFTSPCAIKNLTIKDNLTSVRVETDFYLGDWLVKSSENRIYFKDNSIKLEPRAMAVLLCLAHAEGKTISRAVLLEEVWCDRQVNEDALTTAISKLRNAFKRYQPDITVIETIPKEGYRLLLNKKRRGSVNSFQYRRQLLSGSFLLLVSVVASWILFSSYTDVAAHHYDKPVRIKPSGIYPGVVRMPSFSPDGTSVAYQKKIDGQWQLFITEMDGLTSRQLTHFDVIDGAPAPAWSADGKLLLISRSYKDKCGIYVISVVTGEITPVLPCLYNANVGVAFDKSGDAIYFSNRAQPDTSRHPIYHYSLRSENLKNLTQPQSGEFDFAPKVSPSGEWLAFLRIEKGAKPNIFLMNLISSEIRRLTNENEVVDMSWTPDERIAYIAKQQEQKEFWLTDLNGERTWLGIQDIFASSISICPITGNIAYTSTREINSIERFSLIPEQASSPSTNIIEENTRVWFPHLSPDDSKITFSSGRTGSLQLWMANSTGQEETQLTFNSDLMAFEPSWSPDGQKIAYVTSIYAESEVCVLSVLERQPECLVKSRARKRAPHWTSDSRYVYYASDEDRFWGVWRYDVSSGVSERLPFNSATNYQITDGGEHVFYTLLDLPGIWKWNPQENRGEQIIDDLSSLLFRDWQVVNDSIYYMDQQDYLNRYNINTKEKTQLRKIDGRHQHSGLAVSSDEQSAYLSILKTYDTNIMYSQMPVMVNP